MSWIVSWEGNPVVRQSRPGTNAQARILRADDDRQSLAEAENTMDTKLSEEQYVALARLSHDAFCRADS